MLKRLTALVFAACLSLSGLAGPANATPERLSWRDCAAAIAAASRMQCTELSVPVDWKRPSGERIDLGLAKLPAEQPSQRIGTLVVNLGGLGSTVDLLPGAAEQLAELTNWFDVVAFDPRGIGASSGITCPESSPDYTALMFDHGPAAWESFAKAHSAWSAGCERAAGPLAGKLDAWQVAHDLEAIRGALGEGELNYYGNSYGTVYGQAYADLFPTRVRRMYLDSVADHTSLSAVRRSAPKAEVVRDEFGRFAEWCAADSSCALHGRDVAEVWDALLARARRQPLPAPGAGSGKTVGPEQLSVMTMVSVTRPSGWAAFARALDSASARTGDASGLYVAPPLAAPDRTVARQIQCTDFPFDAGWGGMTLVDLQLRALAPRGGWLMGRFWLGRCAGLPHQGTYPPRPITAEGLPQVLLVNGLYDEGTPAAEGQVVARQLPGSVWVGAETDHAVYLNGNRCVRDLVHRYLLTGELPAPGRVCPADQARAR